MSTGPLCPWGSPVWDGVLTCTFISRSVSQIRMIRTSPELMRRPVSCSQSTTIPAPGEIQMDTSVTEGAWSGQLLKQLVPTHRAGPQPHTSLRFG